MKAPLLSKNFSVDVGQVDLVVARLVGVEQDRNQLALMMPSEPRVGMPYFWLSA
jgi:hypothetical protein